MKLCISLATRGRAGQLVDTVRRSIVNWTDPETVIYVQIDDDDLQSFDYMKDAKLGERVILNVQPREDTIAEKWNRVLTVPADVYMSAADDDPYVIPGYDTKILEAAKRFPDGIGTVYGWMANLSFTGVSAPTAKMCEKLGYIFPPLFPYWFVDHWVDDVFKMIGRISFADIRTDQTKAGKTQEMREPAWWATFFDACYLLRRRQARDIIRNADFFGPEWQKELLLTGYPLIEQRSRGVNENVRQQSKQLETWSGLSAKDPRYERIKSRAMAMVPGLLADPEMLPHERAFFANILTPPTVIQALRKVT